MVKTKDRKKHLSKINLKVFTDLLFLGEKLGFETSEEWKTKIGSIDYVWYIEFPFNFPETKTKRIPIIGFEVETSSRTRKHLKGDILNLLELSPSIGILIILEEGFKGKKRDFDGNVKAVKKYAEGFNSLSNIFVWSEKELKELREKLKTYNRPKEFVSEWAQNLRDEIARIKKTKLKE